jgi:hypothetical protein
MKQKILPLLFVPSIAVAATIDWYETGVGNNTKSVLVVTCGNKKFELVLNKNEIDENKVVEWFDKEVKTVCKGEN